MQQKNANFPTGFQALLLVLALFLCEVLIGALLRDMRNILQLARPELEALVVVLANGLIFVTVMHIKDLTYRDLFHSSQTSVTATLVLLLPPILMLIPAMILCMSVVQDLLLRFAPMSAWEEAMFNRMMDGGPGAVVAICVLAPVLEEMLFRGVILRSFLQQYSRWQAIVSSALLFGFAHLNLYQLAVGLIVGVVLGWLYERTHSLIPCIALHGAYNSGIAFLYWSAPAASENVLGGTASSTWILSLIVAAAGSLALNLMLRQRRPAK